MPKCAVWSCRNSSNNFRIRDGVSFFHYPRDPLLASQWWSVLAPVVADSFKPATAVVCSDHFHNHHKYMCKTRHRLTKNAVPDLLLLGPASTLRRSKTMLPQHDGLESSDDETNMIVDIPEILRPPSESTVCRVCLMTEGRMKRVTEDNYEDDYKQVTGVKWNKEDKLPQHLCWECGQRLRAAATFKKKALAAHSLLHELRSDQSFLTLNDIKLIDRNYHQLVSNLTEKHFPPNQYLSYTTINNNKIFRQQDTELIKLLRSDSKKKYTEKANVLNTNGNIETEDEMKQFCERRDYAKLSVTDKDSYTDTYNNINPNSEDTSFTEAYKNESPKEDILTDYRNLENNYSLRLTDDYKNSNPNCDANLDTYNNVQNSIDTYNNVNDGSYMPTYKNLDGYDSLKFIDAYNYSDPNTDGSNLATYKNIDSDSGTYKNLNPNPIYKDLDTKDLPIYNNLDANKTEYTEKNTHISEKNHVDSNVKDDVHKYDSDESDILVIDAGNDTNLLDNVTLETVIKSEYVGASDGGMSIDELIDIYNNDGDGDERLQELNDRFGDEATVKIEQGWGTQRRTESNSPREKNTQETAAQRMEPKSYKPDVLTGNTSHLRAYEKLNQSLFTLTPVSEAEQIADIFKRQDTFRFKRARFKCYLCFRSFQARRAYDTHMLRHDASNGAFECTVCKARQKSTRAVRTHMHGHHSVRISCNDCGFVTMNRSVARSHEKWHAGTIYQCPHCPSQFDQESTYKSHLRTRHVHAFACAICGFTFVSRKGLAVHRCKRHADADQIPLLGPHCDVCELRFVSEEAYTRHLKMSSQHRPEDSPSNVAH
ncbi:uncharacterized protein [Choristoneura fumiferana]|uniref:uncharacterized protein n=1 Tax=Choristoneura fumiferana TaxID=7141 RepID=UPI003D158CC5